MPRVRRALLTEHALRLGRPALLLLVLDEESLRPIRCLFRTIIGILKNFCQACIPFSMGATLKLLEGSVPVSVLDMLFCYVAYFGVASLTLCNYILRLLLHSEVLLLQLFNFILLRLLYSWNGILRQGRFFLLNQCRLGQFFDGCHNGLEWALLLFARTFNISLSFPKIVRSNAIKHLNQNGRILIDLV